MKKTAILFFLLPFLFGFYDIGYTCPEGCIPNATVDWKANVTNNVNEEMYLVQAYVMYRDQRIAESEERESALTDPSVVDSNRSTYITLTPDQSFVFNFTGRVPVTEERQLEYEFCILRRNKIELWGIAGPTSESCYDGHLMKIFDCMENKDCEPESICSNRSCVKLDCGYCSYTKNHSCHYHECCNDSECRLDENCVDNSCKKINCSDFVVNHNCTEEPCGKGEVIVNFSCESADCAEDEKIVNYSCRKLECNLDEYVGNHSCLPLGCNDSEAFVNHSCVLLDCPFDEKAKDHRCVELDCNLFQQPSDHECAYDTPLLLKVMFLFLIILLLMINTRRLRRLYRRRLVDRMMRR